jgi:hypothetical protein
MAALADIEIGTVRRGFQSGSSAVERSAWRFCDLRLAYADTALAMETSLTPILVFSGTSEQVPPKTRAFRRSRR